MAFKGFNYLQFKGEIEANGGVRPEIKAFGHWMVVIFARIQTRTLVRPVKKVGHLER